MFVSQIPAGEDIPREVNVVIEVPANGSRVKYELDKTFNLLRVDRFMPTSMHYPCSYGFIPSTLAEDGDPVDVLVMTPFNVQPACLIPCRVLGMLNMVDEAGRDSKLMALPTKKVCRQYENIEHLEQLPQVLLDSVVHFFEHYKALESGKWVKVENWVGKEAAYKEIEEAVARYYRKIEQGIER